MFEVNKDSREPFVSVLTPVYNGEEFLRECIESVLNQNYDNWEYVLVNNQSTDSTLEIIEEYAAQDSRIRVHNNEEFLPLMKNLNHAFRQISPESKYCKVVHADDWLFPNCLPKMVEVAEEYPTVGIVSSYRLDNGEVGNRGLHYPSNFNNGWDICSDYLLGNSYYFGSPTSLLIRSDLIRKRDKVYDESYIQSDISACLDILKESDFGFVHKVLTYTRRHEDSKTSTVAHKYSTHMLGDMKIHLEYGPIFLSDENFKRVIKKREEIFYIQFARNMLLGNAAEAYKRHSKELKSIGYRVKHGKLLLFLLREIVLQLLLNMGIELQRTGPIVDAKPADKTEKPEDDQKQKVREKVQHEQSKIEA